ncbi:MAG TPA: protease pro-enzyme activation domain-containing protein [Acidobacteriaceae bacterium]|nr:protease pro-enzyme activation domain-containing protein [Acidobacteriaceae bacterium]
MLYKILVASALLSSLPSPRARSQVNIGSEPGARITLGGHVPSFVTSAADEGPTPGQTFIRDVTLFLDRPPEQQEALHAFLKAQTDKASPEYRHWVTPEQFANRFGPKQADADTVMAWLQANGFTPLVSRSRMFVTISGSADQLASAFHVAFHTFSFRGQHLNAITADPSVPADIAPLVRSINGLSSLPDRIAKVPDTTQSSAFQPRETTTNGNHVVTPADFATIYDINPVYKAGYTGAGQTIAIVGRSQVGPEDIQNFAAFAGLTLLSPTVIVPPGGVDPLQANDDDQNEATLDVTRASSVAPGAKVLLVVSTQAGGGYLAGVRYVIDNQAASIMSISFGQCENVAGRSNTEFYSALFEQGAAEGITTFVAAGDGGVDVCEGPDTAPLATQIASMNNLCASPSVTCVGGTEFNDTSPSSEYWSSTNGTGHDSATGYIPEGAFNDPVNLSTGATQIFVGGGGTSVYIPAPSWQMGLPGNSTGFRATPDIAFTASGHDGYFICLAYEGYSCVPNPAGQIQIHTVAGTSAATPSMAGIQALLNQQENGPLGNINPTIYSLAFNPSNGVFHDATIASSGVTNCDVATPSICNNSTPSPTGLEGGEIGYTLLDGYDLATGWGSIDVYKLLTNWNSVSKPAIANVDLSLSQTLVSAGQQLSFAVSMFSPGVVPTGTIQFLVDGQIVGNPAVLSSGSASLSYIVTGTTQTNSVQAVYSGDSTYATATATSQFLIVPQGTPTFSVTASPITIGAPGQSGASLITVTPINGFTGTVTLSCISPAGVSLGACSFSPSTLSLDSVPLVSSLTLASVAPSVRTGQVSASNHRYPPRTPRLPYIPGVMAVGVMWCAGLRGGRIRTTLRSASSIAVLGCICTCLTSCAHRQTTDITIYSSVNPGTTQEAITFQAIVTVPAGSASPTGMVQLLSNGLTIGAPAALTNGAATFSQTFSMAGNYAITAQYLGSSSERYSMSPSLNETIFYKNPGTPVGAYSLLVQASSGATSQTIPVTVIVN